MQRQQDVAHGISRQLGRELDTTTTEERNPRHNKKIVNEKPKPKHDEKLQYHHRSSRTAVQHSLHFVVQVHMPEYAETGPARLHAKGSVVIVG